jgi:toxin YoeB
MIYHLEFTDSALKDIEFLKRTGNRVVLKKLFILLTELTEHPFTGTGKPEPLKYELTGLWSRRINKEHRLIYQVKENTIVLIIAAKGHYL